MADRTWFPMSVITTDSGQITLPPLLDVAKLDINSPADVWLIANDGTLWRIGFEISPAHASATQVSQLASPVTFSPPEFLTRAAVAPDFTLWCITSNGSLWHRIDDQTWHKVPQNLGSTLVDLTMLEGNPWVARDDGAVWMTNNGQNFVEKTAIIPMIRLAGTNSGRLWGIEKPTPSQGVLWVRRNVGASNEAWFITENLGRDKKWEDVSVTENGIVLLVAADGQVFSTNDGISYLEIPAPPPRAKEHLR